MHIHFYITYKFNLKILLLQPSNLVQIRNIIELILNYYSFIILYFVKLIFFYRHLLHKIENGSIE